MSSHGWHTYGYGVEVTNIKCDSVEQLKALIHLAPELENEIEQWHRESEITASSLKDYYDFDQDYCLGLATIMRRVIMETEGIDLTACDDINGFTYLMYTMTYPWFLTEKEKDLTEKQISETLLKYFSMITDEAVDVDYQESENCG